MECIICLSPCDTFYFEYKCTHKYCILCFIKIVFLQNKTYCTLCKTTGPIIMKLNKPGIESQQPTNIYKKDTKITTPLNRKSEIKAKFNIIIDLFCNQEDYNLLLNLFEYKCIVCFKTLKTKFDLLEHLKSHGYVTCNICIINCHLLPFEYPLFKPFEIKNHLRGLPINILTATLIKSELLKNRLKFQTETKQETLNGHPDCTFCGIYFYDEFILKDHCNENHYICKLCLKKKEYKYFKSINDLKEHNLETHRFLDCCLKNINDFKSTKDSETLFVEDDVHFMEHNWKIHKRKISINCFEKKQSKIAYVNPFLTRQAGDHKNEKFLNETLIKENSVIKRGPEESKRSLKESIVELVPADLNRKNLIKVNIKIPLKSKNTTEILSNINTLTIKYKNNDLSFKELVEAFKALITNGEIINLISTYRNLFEELKDQKVFEKCVEELKFLPFEVPESNKKSVIKKTEKKYETRYKFIDLTK